VPRKGGSAKIVNARFREALIRHRNIAPVFYGGGAGIGSNRCGDRNLCKRTDSNNDEAGMDIYSSAQWLGAPWAEYSAPKQCVSSTTSKSEV
jgi:hypothetical protein